MSANNPNDQISQIIFRWTTDRNSVNQTTESINTRFDSIKRKANDTSQGVRTAANSAGQGLQQLDKTTETLSLEFDKIARKKFFDELILQTQKEIREGKDLNTVLRETSAILGNMDASQLEISNVARGIDTGINGSGGDTRSRGTTAIGQLGVELRNLPAFGPSETIAKLFRTVGIAQEQAAAGAQSLIPALVGVSVAVIGVTAVVQTVAQKFEELREKGRGAAQGIGEVIDRLVRGASLGDIQEEIDANERGIGLRERRRGMLQDAIDDWWEGNAQWARTGDDAGLNAAEETFGQLLGPDADNIHSATAALAELDSQISKLTTANAVNSLLLQDPAIQAEAALNAAAEADREYVANRVAGIQREHDLQLRLSQLAASTSSEQVQARLEAIDAERQGIVSTLAGLNELVAGSEEAREYASELAIQLSGLRAEEEQLTNTLLPLIQAREQEAQIVSNLKALNADYVQSIENTARAQEAATRAADAYDESVANSNEKLADIAENQREKEVDAQESANEKRLDVQEDFNERMEKIQRELTKDSIIAVGERDAMAKYLAEQRAKEEATDLKKANDKRERDIQKGLDKQLEQSRKAADKAIAQEFDRRNKELAIRQRAKEEALFNLQTAAMQENKLLQSIYNQKTLMAAQAGGAFADAFISGALGRVGQGINPSPTPIKPGSNYNPTVTVIQQIVDQRINRTLHDAGYGIGGR